MYNKMNQVRKIFDACKICVVLLMVWISGCKSVDDDVSLDDHLANLMNQREYGSVIASIDALPENEKEQPQRRLYRAQAFCGKAGVDLISLTKTIGKAMDFSQLERSFSRLLRSDNLGVPQKISVTAVKSLVSYAGYLQVIDSFPDLKDSSRSMLMESLVTLQKISDKDIGYYRKARTLSFMLHSVIMLSSLKGSLRPGVRHDQVLDLFCVIDASKFATEFLWITDHLAGALEDAIALQEITKDAGQAPASQMGEILKKVKEIRDNPSKYSASSMSVEIAAAQSLQCN